MDAERFPYYGLVPKEEEANLVFREKALAMGRKDRQAAKDMWRMCSRDALFYINAFGWIYEPRTASVLPFITYPYQDEALSAMLASIGQEDLCVKKSRTMGASWMCLIAFEHQWHFRPMSAFGVMSRTESLVDKADDPDCLFAKIMFFHDHLPPWLRTKYSHTELKLKNEENGATITGASTTGNAFRGGRKTAILMDEFAAFGQQDGYGALFATQPVTFSRIYNSTPQGVGNAYFDVAHDQNIKHLVLPWWDHPRYNPGLYTSKNGVLEVRDHDFKFAEDYPFVLDGKLRSVWYDIECKRTPVPQLIAQEIDMDFLGSGFQFFPKDMLAAHEEQHAMAPMMEGELRYDAETGEPKAFETTRNGLLKLWCLLDAHGRPPRMGTHCIGADVSSGTGASNSCLSVLNQQTGEKVATFVSPNTRPYDLAKLAYALGYWFADNDGREALIVPESNGGHNQQFIRTLMELGYGNVYRRGDDLTGAKSGKAKLGWGSGREQKRLLLEDYSRALEDSAFVNHDRESIEECRYYVFFPDGSIDHAQARNVNDPSGARLNHGDRVIADALAWRGSRGTKPEEVDEMDPPYMSFAWREAEREKEMVAESQTFW